MIVKCIYNFRSHKSLVEDKLYTVKFKKRLSWTMTLVGKSGSYEINRFIKLNGTRILQGESIVNYHYYPKMHNLLELKYAKLKTIFPIKIIKEKYILSY